MAKDDKHRELKDAIRKHLALNGPTKWDEFQAQWPAVPRSTLFRVIKAVRDEITADVAASNSPEALEVAIRRIKNSPEPVEAIREETAKHLPSAPSPRLVSRLGDRGQAHLNMLASYDSLMADGEMLRDYSMKPDPLDPNKKVIKNPAMFERAARLRLVVTESCLKSMGEVYNMAEIGDMYSVVMEEIGKASPEVQHAILVRLRAANNKLAMTVHAEVR